MTETGIWTYTSLLFLSFVSTSLLICGSCSSSGMQSTLNCPTTAFLDSPSMRGCWGWKEPQVTRLRRCDQASCMMRRYWPPLLNPRCFSRCSLFVRLVVRDLWGVLEGSRGQSLRPYTHSLMYACLWMPLSHPISYHLLRILHKHLFVYYTNYTNFPSLLLALS